MLTVGKRYVGEALYGMVEGTLQADFGVGYGGLIDDNGEWHEVRTDSLVRPELNKGEFLNHYVAEESIHGGHAWLVTEVGEFKTPDGVGFFESHLTTSMKGSTSIVDHHLSRIWEGEYCQVYYPRVGDTVYVRSLDCQAKITHIARSFLTAQTDERSFTQVQANDCVLVA